MTPICISLSADPIAPSPQWDSGEFGASVRFLGIVRETEGGKKLCGIDYSAHEPMALKILRQIAAELAEKHGPHPLHLHHRLGFVPVGVASVVVCVGGKHSAETFSLCQEYLQRLKAEVPIWKRFVFVEDGA